MQTNDRVVDSIFFGGGTPSLMAPETVGVLLESINASWTVTDDPEITLEANPGSVDRQRFAGFRAAGVNRISLGIQSLEQGGLTALGRRHDINDSIHAINVATELFSRVSLDLIYGRPGQTVTAWEHELRMAVSMGTGHLSLYQLTIEPGTEFHARHRRGELVLPDDDVQADMWFLTRDITDAAGIPGYEISNHARPGDACRHNLNYWRSGEWAGVGPGAYGRINDAPGSSIEFRHARLPEAWIAQVARDGHGIVSECRITGRTRLAEILFMGLRLTEGMSRTNLVRTAGDELVDSLDHSVIALLEDQGFIEWGRERVRATDKGRSVLNTILEALLE